MQLRKPAYTRIVRGNLFWEPSAKARKAGFKGIPCGPDGYRARAIAEEWNEKVKAANLESLIEERTGKRKRPDWMYPAGSLGDWFITWCNTESYKRKGIRTKEEYQMAWGHVPEALRKQQINKITPTEFETFQVSLEAEKTEYTRWKTVKKIRGIFLAAIKYGVITSSPAQTLPNPQPAPRSQVWTHPQIDLFIETANAEGHYGLALVMRFMYEIAVSPIDARSIDRSMLHPMGDQGYVRRPRSKTLVGLANAISPELWTDTESYIDLVNPVGEIFRRRDLTTWDDRRAFNYDFAKIRKLADLPNHLKALDIRRTANLEAHLGGATKEQRAAFLANSLDVSKQLDQTYTPDTVESSLQIAKRRETGRRLLRSA